MKRMADFKVPLAELPQAGKCSGRLQLPLAVKDKGRRYEFLEVLAQSGRWGWLSRGFSALAVAARVKGSRIANFGS